VTDGNGNNSGDDQGGDASNESEWIGLD
jgi:hypothetical protein